MKTLEKGGDKIQKICTALREETIVPAQEEAQRIVQEAQQERERIIRQAEQEAKALMANTRKQIEQERKVFETSLRQAARQSVEQLKQEIERQLFNKELHALVEKGSKAPDVVAKLIDAIVGALAKDGLDANLKALVPKTVKPAEVNALLAESILKKLSEGTVQVGTIAGGAQIRLSGKQMTLDISDEALCELLTGFLREDFRKLFFDDKA